MKGIDINSENNILNWQDVANDEVQILINKATEGNFYQDRYFDYRYKTVRPLGIKMGFYHFAGKHGAEAEAEYFASFIKGYTPDTILWLDIEQPPESYGWQWGDNLNPSEYVNTFIPYIQKLTGIECGIYSGECFYKDFLQNKIDSNIKLWIAKYSSNSPIGYPNNSWQYSESGTVSGAEQPNSIDMDWFNENILLSNVDTKKVDIKYDESIPTGDNYFQIPGMPFYIEKRTDGGMGIHLDRYNYLTIFKGSITATVNDGQGNTKDLKIL